MILVDKLPLVSQAPTPPTLAYRTTQCQKSKSHDAIKYELTYLHAFSQKKVYCAEQPSATTLITSYLLFARTQVVDVANK